MSAGAGRGLETGARRRVAALAVLFLLASASGADAKKGVPTNPDPEDCPSGFDNVECDSFKTGVADGAADVSVGVSDPFTRQLGDIGQFPYIRGYETGRRKARGR